MIVTYPIQLPYVLGKEQRVIPDSLYTSSEILSGPYPMGKNRFWHGGIHIHLTDRNTPIRAIADGELVAYRYDSIDKTDPYFEKAAYSRSFVLLKHEAELGETSLGISRLTFYSLYMHLAPWDIVKSKTGSDSIDFLRKVIAPSPRKDKSGQPVLDKNKKPLMTAAHLQKVPVSANGTCNPGTGFSCVRRGDILGYCGAVPDNLSQPSTGIHFEIFLPDVNFLKNPHKTVWGRCTLTASLQVFKKPCSTEPVSFDANQPLIIESSAGEYLKVRKDKTSYWIKIDQVRVQQDESTSTNSTQKKPKPMYFPASPTLYGQRENPVDNQRELSIGTPLIPWLNPWLSPGEFQERTLDSKTWVQVFLPDTSELRWALKDAIKYTSDADWQGFGPVEDPAAYSKDGFIDDAGLQVLVAEYEKSLAERNSSEISKTQTRLRGMVTRHPSEWSKSELRKRFERLQEPSSAAKLSADQFDKLLGHIERLSFWEQVPGLPNSQQVWHVHPIRFIEQLARCMWLSKSELASIYPATASIEPESFSDGTTDELRELYRSALNKGCYKYAINTRLRQAHFYGQGAEESESLNIMLEKASGMAYENRIAIGNIRPGDGPKFKGRGFKQLTGRYNYAEYWNYRGWLRKGIDFDYFWETNTNKRYPKIEDENRLTTHPYDCIDTGLWYIAVLRPTALSAMDADDVAKVTKIINGGTNGLAERKKFTYRIRKTLL